MINKPQPSTRVSDGYADSMFNWQQERRRLSGRFEFPIQGFGPGGMMTLWLPASRPSEHRVIRNGQLVFESVAGDVHDDPRIAELRMEAMRGFAGNDFGTRLRFTPALYQYAIAVLNLNYTTPGQDRLSDDDLTFLICDDAGGDDKWVRQMVIHLCGGERYLRTIRQIAPQLLQARTASAPPPATNADASITAATGSVAPAAETRTQASDRPSRRSIWRRFFRR